MTARSADAKDRSRSGLAGPYSHAPHLDTALTYVGTVEQPGNRGPAVRRFMAAVGLPDGHPWCGGFTAYCLDAGGAASPAIRDGRSRMYVTEASASAAEIRRTGHCIERGALAVYRHSRYTGHVEIVRQHRRDESGNCGLRFEAVGGNVSNPEGGPDGVFVKQRSLSPTDYFSPKYLTAVSYE